MAQGRAGSRSGARGSRAGSERSEKGSSRSGSKAGSQSGERESTPLCSVGFCPICLAVTALGEARPDLVEHVLLAGREVLLAVRALIDARLEGVAQPATLERLTIE